MEVVAEIILVARDDCGATKRDQVYAVRMSRCFLRELHSRPVVGRASGYGRGWLHWNWCTVCVFCSASVLSL